MIYQMIEDVASRVRNWAHDKRKRWNKYLRYCPVCDVGRTYEDTPGDRCQDCGTEVRDVW